MKNPYDEAEKLANLERRLRKNPPYDLDVLRKKTEARLNEANVLGPRIELGARILDVGCGIGDTVKILESMGYDASGIDILEYWGQDFDKFWEDRPRPNGAYLSKLYLVDTDDYRLPFPDAYFDLALSAEVFEHVFNYEQVFNEIARVLKPGAISIHVFPGPHNMMEDHINVPIPWLCYYKFYLTIWALLGRRSARQVGLGWRETLALNIETMRFCNYPTARTLKKHACRAGVLIEFASIKRLKVATIGKFFELTKRIPNSLRAIAVLIVAMRNYRYMLIYGRYH